MSPRGVISKTIAEHIGFRMAVAVAAPQDAQRNIADLSDLLADSIVSALAAPVAGMDDGDCPNCGGEGYVYDCVDDGGGCVDPESGCDRCAQRCDWCDWGNQLKRPEQPTLPSDLDNAELATAILASFNKGGEVLVRESDDAVFVPRELATEAIAEVMRARDEAVRERDEARDQRDYYKGRDDTGAEMEREAIARAEALASSLAEARKEIERLRNLTSILGDQRVGVSINSEGARALNPTEGEP